MAKLNRTIELTPRGLETVEAIRARIGIKQKVLLGRIVEWFADQDELTQIAILGMLSDKSAADVARIVLQRMADAEPNGDSGPSSARARDKPPSHKGRAAS